MTDTESTKALQVWARRAGFLYLFVMAAFVVPFLISGSLSAPGNFEQTARNVVGAELAYRIGIGITLAGVIAIVLLSGAFYALLRSVNQHLAAIALALRSLEAVFMGMTVMLRIPALTNYAAAANGLSNREAPHKLLFSAIDAATSIAFAFLAVGSALFFYLLFKAHYIPRWLSGFGVFASMLLGVLAFFLIVAPGQLAGFEMAGMLPLGLAEITTGLWLLIAGVNVKHIASWQGRAPAQTDGQVG